MELLVKDGGEHVGNGSDGGVKDVCEGDRKDGGEEDGSEDLWR